MKANIIFLLNKTVEGILVTYPISFERCYNSELVIRNVILFLGNEPEAQRLTGLCSHTAIK